MSRRTALKVLGLTLVLALAGSATAYAKWRGSDMWGNIMPAGGGGLVNRYPLSAYMLDYHVGPTVSLSSGVSTDNGGNSIAQFFAKWIFFVGVVFIRIVIAIFQWAFSVNLVTGPHGALGTASVVSNRYYNEFVQPFFISFILMFGIWLIWKALKTHERSEVGGALVRVVAFAAISIAIVHHPQDTVGRAYGMVDDAATAVVARGGDSQTVSDSIFRTFIYRPWVTLEFGGMSHCVNPNKLDADGFPLANGPGRTLCRDHVVPNSQGYGGYAARFLAADPNTRDALYQAIATGDRSQAVSVRSTPCVSSAHVACPDMLAGFKVDKADAPAVDMMQGEGSVQRLVYAVGFFFCMVFGALLLALVAVASLFAQIALVALSIFVSFTVLAALFPPLHHHYVHFLKLMGKVLIGKFVYALMLAILLSTSSAMMTMAGQQGFTIALVVQALIFGGAFFCRKAIIAKATSSKAARHYTEHEDHTKAAVATTAAASVGAISGGAGTFAQTMRQGWTMRDEHDKKDEGIPTPDSSSPPASAGREHSPPGVPVAVAGDQTVRSATSDPQPTFTDTDHTRREGEEMPIRNFREDLAAARRGEQVQPDHLDDDYNGNGNTRHYGAVSSSSLADDLRQQRELREVAEDHGPPYRIPAPDQ